MFLNVNSISRVVTWINKHKKIDKMKNLWGKLKESEMKNSNLPAWKIPLRYVNRNEKVF